MKRTSIALIAASTLGVCGNALAAEILSPFADQVIYEDSLALLAEDQDAQDNTARWAVRFGSCDAIGGANNVAGNVSGVDDPFTWTGGTFTAELDISGWDSGLYCFVLNTTEGPAAGSRLTQYFYIVDEYAKVGGTIYLEDNEGDTMPGKSPTDTVDGVVGRIGSMVVGSITVNYRQLGEYRTYEAKSMSFRAANGIGVSDPMAVADIETEDGARILVLDRDASARYPRGAMVLRENFSPSTSD
ncbi:MAG: hypothetical protein P8102_00460, partial [Gammaproteobacteria bacterium]